ncbi:hypothetical protein HDU87_002167 [Geranomyces variabilis]|uniref:Flavin reductase like domain-containing protein n=1 Tax=Geranomyces variabilis TaxID=109894 RepID=A0AAD5TNZ9_9FUNG|nr:hypothetical protein HDU87_002167 [Geranomyces variabilis]
MRNVIPRLALRRAAHRLSPPSLPQATAVPKCHSHSCLQRNAPRSRCSSSSTAAATPAPTPAAQQRATTDLFNEEQNPQTERAVSAEEFRGVMRTTAAPVAVITLATPNSPHSHVGITCSSVTSVSLDPPIISFCVRSPSRVATALASESTPPPSIAVHLLAASQVRESMSFSSPHTQHAFEAFAHRVDQPTALPILEGCLGVMVCELMRRVEIGDHEAWFAKVQRIAYVNTSQSQSDRPSRRIAELPLLYHRGEYKSIKISTTLRAIEATELQLQYLRAAWKALTSAAPGADVFSEVRSAIQSATPRRPYRETHARLVYHLVSVALANERSALSEPSPTEKIIASDPESEDYRFLQFIKRPEHSFLTTTGFATLRDHFYSPAVFCSQEAAESFIPPNKHPLPTSLEECIVASRWRKSTPTPLSSPVAEGVEVPPPRDNPE